MKLLTLVLLSLLGVQASAAAPKITYFACKVQEERTSVSVKFAIANFDPDKKKGQLISYPGADEDQGMILVDPTEVGKKKFSTRMANLNGQGGDLRIKTNGDIFLFGDGDGYQFTELVVWADSDEDHNYREGYARDYGPSYGSAEYFKTFITCEKSDKLL